MSLTVGTFSVTTAARNVDPKQYAQERAAQGDWRPTDQLIRKADPDFVKRWFILEAKKHDLRRMWRRSVSLQQRTVENGTSQADRLYQEAADFWQEYAALDNRWIGDVQEIKAAIAKENLNGSLQ